MEKHKEARKREMQISCVLKYTWGNKFTIDSNKRKIEKH